MIKRTLYLAGMLLLLARIKVYAQAPVELSLAKAWEVGLAHYPALAESQAQVQIPEADMHSLDKLRLLPLKAGQARPVLEDVATLTLSKLPGQVNRRGPNRYVMVLANTAQKDLGAAARAVKTALKNAGEPPRGVLVDTEGSLVLLAETLEGLQTGLLAVIGALLALNLSLSNLSLFSLLGLIMLMSLVAKKALLIVDFTNQLKAGGKHFREALLLAGKGQMRPMLVTTLSLVIGMLPLALAKGTASEWKNGLAWVIIGGLLSSLILTVYLVPAVYKAVDTLKEKIARKRGGKRHAAYHS